MKVLAYAMQRRPSRFIYIRALLSRFLPQADERLAGGKVVVKAAHIPIFRKKLYTRATYIPETQCMRHTYELPCLRGPLR